MGSKSFFADLLNKTAALSGDTVSRNSHQAVNEAMDGMKLFRDKAEQVGNVDFSKAKGNLFEYIEAQKFNSNAALAGSKLRAATTDSLGDPHAAADILIRSGEKTVREVQAKVSGKAADGVFYQAGGQKGHWGKYQGMQRLIHKDENYNEDGSLLDEAKKLAKNRGETQGIHAEEYRDVYENLTDELNHDGVSSGGTTMHELEDAYDDPVKYAKAVENQQWLRDMKTTSLNMAKAGAVTNGIATGISDMFLIFQDEKTFREALQDVGVQMVKGGIRGGATGVVSTAIRYGGTRAGIGILTDSSAATVMAGGIIDGGVALYSYARGEITAEELQKELVDTTAKAVTTVYFTKAVGAVFGAANPFLPMAIYTAASYVVTSTRAIIENAELNAEEYNRLAAIYEESTKQVESYRRQMNEMLETYEIQQRNSMQTLLNTFEYNMESGQNYDLAVNSIIQFADKTGIMLQHAEFSDFKKAMKSDMDFTLKRR